MNCHQDLEAFLSNPKIDVGASTRNCLLAFEPFATRLELNSSCKASIWMEWNSWKLFVDVDRDLCCLLSFDFFLLSFVDFVPACWDFTAYGLVSLHVPWIQINFSSLSSISSFLLSFHSNFLISCDAHLKHSKRFSLQRFVLFLHSRFVNFLSNSFRNWNSSKEKLFNRKSLCGHQQVQVEKGSRDANDENFLFSSI